MVKVMMVMVALCLWLLLLLRLMMAVVLMLRARLIACGRLVAGYESLLLGGSRNGDREMFGRFVFFAMS